MWRKFISCRVPLSSTPFPSLCSKELRPCVPALATETQPPLLRRLARLRAEMGVRSLRLRRYAKFPRDPNGANGVDEVVTQPASTGTFANTSTRAEIANGENQLIAGFIIAGAGSKQILIRGLGPSLAAFGLTGTLQDPVLDLRTETGTNITVNDNWALAANAAQIPANLRPADPRESAIWTTLAPGSYTAIESGKSGATGTGLLEVYDVASVASSQLANISKRGLGRTGNAVK